jgi:Peptidase S46
MSVKQKAFHFSILSILFYLLSNGAPSYAKEGVWIPATLKHQEKEMKADGLDIPIEQLYNENGTGLNNAIVLFGRGCTGELISAKGLILTNHHCGYGSVQSLSGTDADYFANGFFAQSMKDELPCKGLTVTFVRRIENVTERILTGISDTMKDARRDSIIAARIAETERNYAAVTHLDATIKPYFDGNQYWVAFTETFRDIRLVGFPPNGIGAFGGDDENWMWPRHTGDFSMFRVYAGPDNKPADYSASNKPYESNQYLTINIAGYKEGDYTMVYGFPGTTKEYISSYELDQVASIIDPIGVEARTKKLDVWDAHMKYDRANFIRYISKRGGVTGGRRKWQGEIHGLQVTGALAKKQAFEKKFQQWADTQHIMPYAKTLLGEMRVAAKMAEPFIRQDQYTKEAVLGIDLIQQGSVAETLIKCFRSGADGKALQDTLAKAVKDMQGFYKNFDTATDKDVFVSLMSLYFTKCYNWLPEYFAGSYRAYDQDINRWANDVYRLSIIASKSKLDSFVANATAGDSIKILADRAWILYSGIDMMRKEKILPLLKDYYDRMHYLNRLYINAQMAMNSEKEFYPDANRTLRLSYGKVKGLKPDGSSKYTYQTTLADVVALDDPKSDVFKVPAKLKDLYRTKDYGRWGVDGTMPVAFIASNHTSGGNSGSPVLNKKGQLIGTNFDRAYEGTMSDYYFDPDRCRNISVDIRYTLFIVEKFGGAKWLIDEMNIVK